MVWQKARILKNGLYDLVKLFPPDEKFRLVDQIIRAARSITCNIAEGHGRFTFKEQFHFCIIARGSLSEIWNHLLDALDCQFISQTEVDNYYKKIAEVGKLLNRYISFLREKL